MANVINGKCILRIYMCHLRKCGHASEIERKAFYSISGSTSYISDCDGTRTWISKYNSGFKRDIINMGD